MKKFSAIAILALVVLAAVPAGAATSSGATATAQNTIASVIAGSTAVNIGVDSLSSVWQTTRSATSEVTIGTVGGATLPGGSKRAATNKTSSGKDSIGTGTKSVGGLASVTVAGGTVAASVTPAEVLSEVELRLASADLLSGLATLGTAATTTASDITSSRAKVDRTVTIGQAGLLSIGDLLTRLGISPLSLACAAVEEAGATLGVDTSDACSQLAAATAAIGNGQVSLDNVVDSLTSVLASFSLSQVQSDFNTVDALVCGALDVVCQNDAHQTIVDINSDGGYGATLPADFDGAKAAMLARLQEILDDYGDISLTSDAVTDAASGTCADASDALGAVIAGVPSEAGSLQPVLDTLDVACGALASTLDDLLNTPLLSLTTLKVSLQAIATAVSPTATVGGTLASLKVGALAPVGVPLSLSSSDFEAAATTVKAAVSDVIDALALGLTAPEFDLMKTATSKGKQSDGTWYAKASLTAVHFKLPSQTIDVPSVDPLGILAGTGGLAAPARASFPGRASAPVTTPAVQLDVAKFAGAATFKPGVKGNRLAITGLDDSSVFLLAFTLFAGAILVRRFLQRA
ncbi:MAG: hypothetical protein ABR548_12610 [Actinomycetota bacterium]|nr:hypothetical protein [Actinomycetota bacterium]